MLHSSHTDDPRIRTAPPSVVSVSTPVKRFALSLEASWRQRLAWSPPRIEIPMRFARLSTGQVEEDFCTANITSGGSMETPTVNEDATRTWRSPATSAASAATPLGKCPKVSRSCRESAEYVVKAMSETPCGG